MTTTRQILHVDMDAFYASVEQRDRPELRGQPLVVGGDGSRGVVAAASYEVRRYGVRSAMPMREARRRCPQLVCVQPRMAHYQAVSEQVFEIFHEFTPTVEGLSLDEAFLDVSASLNLFGSAEAIALSVKDRVRERTRLSASVGVAPNKLVAKIASDLDKPDGLVVIRPEDLPGALDELPVQVIPGIGKVTLARLHEHGIRRVVDLRLAADGTLEAIFGRFATRARERAGGIDDRPVVPDRADKSISAEETFAVDLADGAELQRKLLQLVERTTRRLRDRSLMAGTVQVKIRTADFTTFTRQKTMHPPAAGTDQVYAAARQLLGDWLAGHPGAKLRLLGVGGSELAPATQADLFGQDDPRGNDKLDRAADQVRARFGAASLTRARSLDPERTG